MNEMLQKLKDHINTVDWSKVMRRGDVQNAAIGSALGGLMLGGASLARDKDPEESKLTPVGDALVGALAGGVAGYGIPKGLSLFANGASPNEIPAFWSMDGIKKRWLPAAGRGAVTGEIIAGAKTVADLAAARAKSVDRIRSVFRNGLGIESTKDRVAHAVQRLQEHMKAHPDDTAGITRLSHTVDKLKARADAFLPQNQFEGVLRIIDDRIRAAKAGGKDTLREYHRLSHIKGLLTKAREQVAGTSLLKKDTWSKIIHELQHSGDNKVPYGANPIKWPLAFLRNRKGYAGRNPGRVLMLRHGLTYPLVTALANIALEGMSPSNQNNFAPGKD